MKKTIKTEFTETEFRQIIREELKAVLNNEAEQVAATDQEGFIDMAQAAEFLKMAKQTLYTKTSKNDDGNIPFTKKGKRLLFKKSELNRWLSVPTIVSISVQIISQNETAILLECETSELANGLDLKLDGYSILWSPAIEGRILVTLRSPGIGSYQKHIEANMLDKLAKANCLAAAHRNNQGILEFIEQPRPLNVISRPGL